MIEHLWDEDLLPWARKRWEEVYAGRVRAKASRQDLLYGFIGGLLAIHTPEVVLTERGVRRLALVRGAGLGPPTPAKLERIT